MLTLCKLPLPLDYSAGISNSVALHNAGCLEREAVNSNDAAGGSAESTATTTMQFTRRHCSSARVFQNDCERGFGADDDGQKSRSEEEVRTRRKTPTLLYANRSFPEVGGNRNGPANDLRRKTKAESISDLFVDVVDVFS
jgi:hypothetical protein